MPERSSMDFTQEEVMALEPKDEWLLRCIASELSLINPDEFPGESREHDLIRKGLMVAKHLNSLEGVIADGLISWYKCQTCGMVCDQQECNDCESEEEDAWAIDDLEDWEDDDDEYDLENILDDDDAEDNP